MVCGDLARKGLNPVGVAGRESGDLSTGDRPQGFAGRRVKQQ